MNISSNIAVNSISGFSAGAGIDEEYKRIIEKLMALGITPSGNKASDKAKLREYEMKQLKAELGADGKGSVNKSEYITISSAEIEQIKQTLQARAEEEKSPEFQEKKEAAQNQTGATQEAILNQYFIKKKKQFSAASPR